MASMSTPEPTLPPYSPSGSIPPYSSTPREDERCLALNSRVSSRHSLSDSTFCASHKPGHSKNGFSVELEGQEPGIQLPTYGRHSLIRGRVKLERCETVQRVDVELVAHMKVSISEGGSKTRTLLNDVHTLWQRDISSSSSSSSSPSTFCPTELPFVVPIALEYDYHGTSRPLPPSYHVDYPGVPGLAAKVVYELVVRIARGRALLWKETNKLSVLIKYYPRARAPRPIPKPSLPFINFLKIVPEDYTQVESVLKARTNSGVQPIHCDLFIPASCIYAISDEIPFHLQLVGTRFSLAILSSDASPAPEPTHPSHAPTQVHVPTVRVFLYRQITVDVRGQKAWRTCVTGEGRLVPSEKPSTTPCAPPPPYRRSYPPGRSGSDREADNADGSAASLDWDGTVRVTEDIQVGGFACNNLHVKDFIVLSIKPPEPARSPFIEHQNAHPIRLVSDAMHDEWDG